MIFDILTIFPSLFSSFLNESIIRRARLSKKIDVNLVNIRDYALDKHQMTDDRPFGGGEGMVMKPEPLAAATQKLQEQIPAPARIILLSPQGKLYNQEMAEQLSREKRICLVCGRYEGVDSRYIDHYITDEISIGDFILTGGELGAMIVVDSISRLLPGVLGCSESATNDTFSRGLLKHPQYTRPRVFEEEEVPEFLLSGDHKHIDEHRFLLSVTRTLKRRPDLLAKVVFSKAEIKFLKKQGLYETVKKLQTEGQGHDKSD